MRQDALNCGLFEKLTFCYDRHSPTREAALNRNASKSKGMQRIAILHNIPIHYIRLLCNTLADRGAALTVLFVASDPKISLDPIDLSAERYAFRVGFQGRYEDAPAMTRMMFAWRELNRISPAVVVISGYHAIECWTALLWARAHSVPVVLWCESNRLDAVRHWPKEILKRFFVRHCQMAHVYGSASKQYLLDLGMPGSRIADKRAVVDCDLFRTEKGTRVYRRGGVVRFLYVGRLVPQKNLHALLVAFSGLVNELGTGAVRLVIAGRGPCEQSLRRTCADLGLDGDVEFRGYCLQQSLPGLYRSCDVFVLPSTTEPWGLVVNEAMLCRLPIVVSNQCGCSQDLVTPETGWAFSPSDRIELDAVLYEAATASAERLASMGDASYELASNYTPDACADRVLETLSRVIRT
jgi:glycosyltransferase involved in cell wall biosynthesis